MEKGKLTATELTSALQNLRLNSPPETTPSPSSYSYTKPSKKVKPRSLVSLCLGVIGQHFEDIVPDLAEIAEDFPPEIKLMMVAIARRRKLLDDDVLIALAESSWELLDISGSDVTDFGLAKVAQRCTYLRAVDISRCDKVTAAGVSEIICYCRSLEILRCGGCRRSDFTARRCLNILKPKLNDLQEESWEELDSKDIANGAESLRWLVWPRIDEDSMNILAAECPRIIPNPKQSPLGFRGVEVPVEALACTVLDSSIIKDIDPKTWKVPGAAWKVLVSTVSDDASELHIAERFRLAFVERDAAFVERDARLAPKRSKNTRQHKRRAERDWLMASTDAKSIVLASQASKFLDNQS